MGKKKNDAAQQSSTSKLGFAVAHNNSWYSSTEPGEAKDAIIAGRFPPLHTSFKRPASLLDPFDKSLNTAMTGERYAYMFSCNDIIHRDYPLRYSSVNSSSSKQSGGGFNVLPKPEFAAQSKRSGNRKAHGSTLHPQPTLAIAKGSPQQGVSADGSRFSIRAV